MGSIVALCRALGARKNSVGRRIIFQRGNAAAVLGTAERDSECYVNSRLPLGALLTSIHPKKTIHGLNCSLPPPFS